MDAVKEMECSLWGVDAVNVDVVSWAWTRWCEVGISPRNCELHRVRVILGILTVLYLF